MSDQAPITVYVVCEAEYDARAAVAAFTNAAAAEQHAADYSDAAGGVFRCRYEVVPLPLLDAVPQRAEKHLHAGRVCRADVAVEDEQTWTVGCWDYDSPPEPVVSIDDRRPEMPRVHVAAASAEAAHAAFWAAVAQVFKEAA